MTECERPTPYDERPDLDLVAAYLEAHGLSAERFSKEETLIGKTPDFRVRKGGAIVAYCEVKAPQDDPWFDDLLRCAPPDTIVGHARSAPTFKRLARHLKKAASQLAAVNPNRTELNILSHRGKQSMARNELVKADVRQAGGLRAHCRIQRRRREGRRPCGPEAGLRRHAQAHCEQRRPHDHC